MLWKFREIMGNNLIWASPLIIKGSVNSLLYHGKSVCLKGKLHFVYIITFHFPENYILTQSTVPENITTINEGDNVTIVCKVSGNGIKRVEWYKDKMELPSRYNNTRDFNISIADLTAVTVSQAGEYECRTSIIPTPWVGYQAESFVLQVIGKGDLLFNLVDYTKWILVTVYPNRVLKYAKFGIFYAKIVQLTPKIFGNKHSFVLTFFATNIYVNCKHCKP